MRFLRDNGLALFFGFIFLCATVAESVVGHTVFNQDQLMHGGETISWGRYLVSSHFGEAMLENWQSEWLQMFLFALATIWLVQRGSAESKQPGEQGLQSDEKQLVGGRAPEDAPRWAKVRGWRTAVYENSFLIVMLMIFLGSWVAQSATAWTEFNNEQMEHGQAAVSWLSYLGEADFWETTMQNWQSEFLALVTMVVVTVYLRQRGSPESKPVGAPHSETSSSV
jgi:membrane protein implicated in regulation of membrane protease activity